MNRSQAPIPSTSQSRLDDFLPASPSAVSSEQVRLTSHTQRVYVLCGVVGSGKSTLASQFEALYPNYYVRVNQDALGTRKKCEDLTRLALDSGKSVLIDRQNFDASQRYTWLQIGHEYSVEVVALVFQTTKQICADRLKSRRFHETIKSAEQGLQVLNSMVSIFTAPGLDEGFHRIFLLPTSLPHRYKLSDVNSLLQQIDAAPLLPAILPSILPTATPRGSPFAPSSRGGSSSAGRGSSRGRGRGSPIRRGGESQLMSSWLAARHASTSAGSTSTSRALGDASASSSAAFPSKSRTITRATPYPTPVPPVIDLTGTVNARPPVRGGLGTNEGQEIVVLEN